MLQPKMQLEPWVVMHVVVTCMILHNLLQTRSGGGHFQPENMGLNMDGGLQGNHLPYYGMKPQ